MKRPSLRSARKRVHVGELDVTGILPAGLHSLYRRRRIRRLIAWHFNRAYYYDYEHSMFTNRWLGHLCLKYPTDMWAYQEILSELRPAVVVEAGTFRGGSALFLATIMDATGVGQVISIDVEAHEGRPEHPRITYLQGSSTDPDLVAEVAQRVGDASPVMVILDSDHSRDHVRAELDAYAGLVDPGSYLIVEDTNVNGHPVLPEHGVGPMEAVRDFLSARDDFAPDRWRERGMLTANPNGFLRRTR